MSDIAIRASKLGKRYRIGERQRYLALRDVLTQTAKAPLRLFRASAAKSSSNGAGHIWALKDASFEVREGEVVGIIGRNGAGKSTLLKILARITKPTEGFATVLGRLGSLLEVGTGFHWELTGRENVYLSGAILGMAKREIARKFDEIVAFAEVDEFIDTPLKHYSTGMKMRLAFAVAAHIEPEILLVDEVLAVGDIAFQKKCLGKMGDVARKGRTVLFVSHQLGAVQQLCGRAIWLSDGHMHMDGCSLEVVNRYMDEVISAAEATPLMDRRDRLGDGRIRIVQLHWETTEGEVVSTLRSGAEYSLVLTYTSPDGKGKNRVLVSFAIKDHSGVFLLLHQTNFSNQSFGSIPPDGRFVCRVPRLPLAAGEYTISVYVGMDESPCDNIEDAAKVAVEYGNFFGTGHPGKPGLCKVLTECSWELRGASVVDHAYRR